MAEVDAETLQFELDIRALSQQELARRAGIQEKTLSGWKRGKCGLSPESLAKIATVLATAPVHPELTRILIEPEKRNSRSSGSRAAVEEARNAPAAPSAA